jgi:ketosteroid isomerase-like protein
MRSPALVLALLLVSGACVHADRDRAAIVGVLRAQQDAWNRGDLEAFLRGYDRSPELVFTSGAEIRRGFDETRAQYQARYGAEGAAGASKMGRLDFADLEVRLLGRDGAVVLGRWRVSQSSEAGEGVFTLALLRTPHGWRIVHDHTSAARPPRAP